MRSSNLCPSSGTFSNTWFWSNYLGQLAPCLCHNMHFQRLSSSDHPNRDMSLVHCCWEFTLVNTSEMVLITLLSQRSHLRLPLLHWDDSLWQFVLHSCLDLRLRQCLQGGLLSICSILTNFFECPTQINFSILSCRVVCSLVVCPRFQWYRHCFFSFAL